ncbi:hypothetical protein FPV67DRAFT_1652419 [Lyophyllum atratum]|nr:hypothetical protein FPV67DRAFT_1652419 [Lyophyllum atratum]
MVGGNGGQGLMDSARAKGLRFSLFARVGFSLNSSWSAVFSASPPFSQASSEFSAGPSYSSAPFLVPGKALVSQSGPQASLSGDEIGNRDLSRSPSTTALAAEHCQLIGPAHYSQFPVPHLMTPQPSLPSGQYPYLPFPPPTEPTPSNENGQNGSGPGYMMFHPPPGMLYYPAQTQAYNNQVQNGTLPAHISRTKRKQVKMACTNCANACKRCDERRPCERCIKYNISETCVDGHRKERKKGIKRGPYKRKNKMGDDTPAFTVTDLASQNLQRRASHLGNGERPPPLQLPSPSRRPPLPAPASAPAPPAPLPSTMQQPPMQPVSHFVPGEGFYPMYYPPPGFMPPPPHDGNQPGAEGGAHPNGPPPPHPYFLPGPYPPYPYPGFMHGPPQPHAAHPHAYPYPMHPYAQVPPPHPQAQMQPPVIAAAADPAGADKPVGEAGGGEVSMPIVIENPSNGKKRGRAPKNGGEPKPKKAKRAKASKDPGSEAGAAPGAAGEEAANEAD